MLSNDNHFLRDNVLQMHSYRLRLGKEPSGPKPVLLFIKIIFFRRRCRHAGNIPVNDFIRMRKSVFWRRLFPAIVASRRPCATLLATSISLQISSQLTLGQAYAQESPSPSLLNEAAKVVIAKDAFKIQNSSGEQLVYAWYKVLAKTGSKEGIKSSTHDEFRQSRLIVLPYLDKALQVVRANGQRFSKSTYIPTDIDDYGIREIYITRPSPGTIVARYQVRVRGATLPESNLVMSDAWAPRLTVFNWNPSISQWQVLSHANFNTPIAAICDSKPLFHSKPEPVVNQADYSLAKDLIENWFKSISIGKGMRVMNRQAQGQTSSGLGWTTAKEYKPGKISSFEISDLIATRNNNLLVASANIRLHQAAYASTLSLSEAPFPRLLTFMKQPGSDWQLIASATFAEPKMLPAGAKCIQQTQ